MNSLRASLFLVLGVLTCASVQSARADVFASHVRVTQPTSNAAFDGSFADGTGAAIRFVLADRADSIVVQIKSGQTVVRTIRAVNYSRGDTSIVWDGRNNAGVTVSDGSYSVEITTYDKGYNAYTTIYYHGEGNGLSTRGVTTIRNPSTKNFGFIYGIDNGGYLGTTGILRLSADGIPWGNSKGVGKLDNTGITLGPSEARYSPEADNDGYIYVISHTARQLLRFHTDTLNVAIVDSGNFGSWYINGIGIMQRTNGKRIAYAARNASGVASLGTDSRILSFHLQPGQTRNTGNRDTLVTSEGLFTFWDVVFGRDSLLYATFIYAGDAGKSGIAKFNLAGKSWPLKVSDTSWTVRVDSGRVSTCTYYFGPASDGSKDVLYFVNARIASGNPPTGQGVYAVTNLNAARPTRSFIYPDLQNNASITRSDVAVDAVGNVVYFENSNEEIVILSPPTGANNYTFVSPTRIVVGTATSVHKEGLIPPDFVLRQNYPNPFNPSTTIEFGVPVAAHVRLGVYNLLGQEVAVVRDEFSEAGHYRVVFDAKGLPSGTYFYVLRSGEKILKNKMILLK